jgi:hypothetical protein
MLTKETLVDERRQIRTTLGGEFETLLDWVEDTRHAVDSLVPDAALQHDQVLRNGRNLEKAARSHYGVIPSVWIELGIHFTELGKSG